MKTSNLDQIIIDAIQDKKGSSISLLDLKKIAAAPAFEFVICQGKTPSQTTAIADSIVEKIKESEGRNPASVNGMRNGQWIIVDYGDIMIHIFTPEFREFYNLEDLWSDGEILQVPDLD